MKIIDIFQTRNLKFRMTLLKRMPIELETGIWAVTGFPMLKEVDLQKGIEEMNKKFEEREVLRKEKPYDDSVSHIYSHRGNVVYPDGQLHVLKSFLEGIYPENLYLYPENKDYKKLFFLLVNGALNMSGLEKILDDLSYFENEDVRFRFKKLCGCVKNLSEDPELKTVSDIETVKEELLKFVVENYDVIQERISKNVFKGKNGSADDQSLKGINIADKFDVGYVIDPSLEVLISYNEDHLNQGTIIEPKIESKDIIGIIINSSKIESLKDRKISISNTAFEELAVVHLGTLRNFIDWFGAKEVDKEISKKLYSFISKVEESFFYVDADSKLDNVFNPDELVILNDAARDFLNEQDVFKEGESQYDFLIEIGKKYLIPVYSSNGEVLWSN